MKLIKARTATRALVLMLSCGVGMLAAPPAQADEGGVSFWLPGQFWSLNAAPADPGWSLPLIYYHWSADAGGSAELATAGRVTLGLDVTADVAIFAPTYVFTKPVWGGQASIAVGGGYGRADATVDATLTAPNGDVVTGSESGSLTAFADLYPTFTVKWNKGVHNSMVYTALGVPVGSYEVGRLVNLGLNHWSADIGGGYTYLNPETGREFSATAGITYNFENPDTNYQNGLNAHLDWGLSQFVSEQTHIGLVGYFYNQLTGDSGSGAVLGDFKSRVSGIGPQVGHLFEMGGGQAYFSAKAYWEFDSKNRPADWNAWLTLVIPL